MTTAGRLDRRARSFLVPAAVLLLYTWVAIVTAWLGDDSFISFRQVLNVIDGDGLAWNYGQRVQAFTHPSWVVLLTLVVSVTREVFLTTIALSVVLSLCSIIFVVQYVAALPAGRGTSVFAYSFLVVLAFSKSFTDYMTSGLENPLSFFLVGFAIWQAKALEVSADRDRGRSLLFSALALAFLNRFDYAVLLLPFACSALLMVPRDRIVRAVFPGLATIAAWFAFSLLYFGSVLPNTYYAKLATGFPREEIYARGATYFWVSLADDPVTMVLVAFGTIAGFISRSWLNRSLALGTVFYGAYVFNIGGDFMQGRFFAILAYIALFNLVALDHRRRPRLTLKAVALLSALVAVAVGPKPVMSGSAYRDVEVIDGVGDERGTWYLPYGLLSPEREWPRIGPRATRRPTEYRLTCSGKEGLTRRDVFSIDVCGLADAFLSRLPPIRSRDWRIGHHFRKVPTDYGNALVARSAGLADTALQPLFDDVQLVISGRLFSLERLRAIVRLHTPSAYRYDRETYAAPGVQLPVSSLVTRTEYARVNHEPREEGALWVWPMAEGVVWLQEQIAVSFDAGLLIAVQPSIATDAISLSLDGNDTYRVTLNGGEYVTRIERSLPADDGGRLQSHRIQLPESRTIVLVEIEPIEGDGYYGLGHLLIEGQR